MQNVTLNSSRPYFDMDMKDKIVFSISKDRQNLRINTICFEGPIPTENVIILKNDDETKSILKQILNEMEKT